MPSGQLRATPDGTLFVAGNGYGRDDKFRLVDEADQKWQVREPDIVAAYPGPDGKRLYCKDQIITPAGAAVAGKPAALASVWYVPAVSAAGDYFLRVNEVKVNARPFPKNVVSVSLHKGTDVETPVLPAWVGLPETDGLLQHFGGTEPLDKHLILIPEAKLLVIVNRDKNRLVVRKLPL